LDVYRRREILRILEAPLFEFSDTTAARAFVLCTTLLVLEMAGLAFATPLLRAKRNVWLNEEDAERFSGTVADVEDRGVARLVRVHRNALENFAPFFALGLLWLLTGANVQLGAWLFVVFTVARTAHLCFYLVRRGRLRTASHTVAFLALVVLAGGLLWRGLGGV
jgi:glutathione S-transferase